MTYLIQNIHLKQYSAYCGIAAALVCTATGGVKAQDLQSSTQKQTKGIILTSTLLSSAPNQESKYLKTEPLSARRNTNKEISSQDVPDLSEKSNHTWTRIDSLSPQSLPDITLDNSFSIAQQVSPEPSQTENPQQPSPQNSQDSDNGSSKNINSENSSTLPSRFYIGPDFFQRDYGEEEITPRFKSDEFGTLYGLQATYDYVKSNSIYFGFGFRYGTGQTNYSGIIQDRNGNVLSPARSKTDNHFLNLEGRLGYTFQPGGSKGRLLLSPFVGLGYHNWDRNISGGTTPTVTGPISSPDLSETYSWGYVGPGFHAEYKVSPKFDIGINAKLMVMFGGAIDVKIGPQGVNQVQDSGKLGNDLQYEVELPLTFHLLDKPRSGIDLKITPYYRSQDIARGPIFNSGTAREPASTTSVYGVTAGLQFRF